MIHVRVKDDLSNDGVHFELEGHAVPTSDEEELKVCAAASMLMMTLTAITGGEWGGNDSGLMRCHVTEVMVEHADFVYSGLLMLDSAYPGHLVLDRQDTKLFTSKRTAAWTTVAPPAPPTPREIPGHLTLDDPA